MNDRVKRLRDQSVSTEPYVSAGRARLLTDFYANNDLTRHPVPVQRALAFRYLLNHQTICINSGELIVGERGPAPKATATYPELCCHSLEDLDVLNTRRKTPFRVSDEVRALYKDRIIPFWNGKSMRKRVFSSMSEAWHKAFNAGVFTEFMEQRAPGHAVLDDKIYHEGFLDFKAKIEAAREGLRASNDPNAEAKDQELQAMAIGCDAIVRFAERHAEMAGTLAKDETNPLRKCELEQITDICSWIPTHAPRTFWEALQMYWFVHLGVIIELNEWDSFNPGRLDQYLYPFYKADLEAGRLTPESAKELLECLWIKFSNQPAPPKVGITEEQSATYNDFVLINVGGVGSTGENAVNDLSYLILDVVEEMRLPFTGTCIQLSKKNPDRFLKRTLEIVKTGFGQPSIFNTDAILQEFLRAGKSLEDARAGGPSGCVTVSAFGVESCVLTGYMNWPKILELTLHDGIDPRTGERVGIETGDPRAFARFEDLFASFTKQLEYFVDLKVEGNHVIEQLFKNAMPAPFLSVLIDDCIEKGRDYNAGGARYPTTYLQGVGLGTTTDALAAIKTHVYEKKAVAMDDLLAALAANFDGHEALRQRLVHESPAFGNDDEAADAIAQAIFDTYFHSLDGRPNTNDGHYRVNLLPTTVHIYFGQVTGALPNGRLAGKPLSDGISPSQGADTRGPTAVIKSMGKIDHVRTGGTLLNQKFLPDLLADEEGLDKLAKLVRTYFRYDGHHIQFNVVDAKTLRRAQEHPEEHRNLIVRVAGYSDYFCNLEPALQEEVIARTAHGEW
jgi:pyruvate formate-lyase/glycerol dehydratase family glycyl radical enzyme